MRRFKFGRYLLWVLLVIGATLGAYWIYSAVDLTGPDAFTIATGREGGAYYAYAARYADQLAAGDVTLDILPTAGSVETLERLIAREIPVGFVQSGTAEGFDVTGLVSLGSLFYEPVLVFFRRDSFDPELEYLTELRGRRIAVGEPGSGTNRLARQLLADNDVTEENTTFRAAPNSEAFQLLVDGEVDAGFFVLAPQSSLLQELLLAPELDLMDFRRAGAYEARYRFLTHFEITEGTVDLVRNIPAENKTVLATTATLVANELLHPDSARQLLTAAIAVHAEGGYFEEAGEFPSAKNTELPVPSNVAKFLETGPSDLERYMPVSLASAAERIIFVVLPLVALLYPLLRMSPPLVSSAFRYQIYRWYTQLRKVELNVERFTPDELDEQIQKMVELQQHLTKRVRVPLFYQHEFYNLRIHLKLVIDRLRERRDRPPPAADAQSDKA